MIHGLGTCNQYKTQLISIKFSQARPPKILKNSIQINQPTRCNNYLFIDFKAAYDSIDRSRLYAAMGEMNIPQKLIARQGHNEQYPVSS